MSSVALEVCLKAAAELYRARSGDGREVRWRRALAHTLEALMMRAVAVRWPAAREGLGRLREGERPGPDALAGLAVSEGAWSAPRGWAARLPEGVDDVASLSACYAALQEAGPDAGTAALSRARRKRHGSYYTPRVLLEALLEPLSAATGRARRVCDPACGAGAMLLAVRGHRIRAGWTPEESLEGLCGVDRDPIAVTLCRFALWQAGGCREADAEALRRRVLEGDALAGPPPPGVPFEAAPLPEALRPLDWPSAFPDIWSEGGFELVVANPPWERIKAQAREIVRAWSPRAASSAHRAEREAVLDQASAGGAARRAVKRAREASRALSQHLRGCGAFPWSARGDLNTYPLFVERCWQMLSEGGRAGLIVPSGLATDLGQARLFSELVDRGAVARLIDVENHKRRFFPSVDGRFRFALVELRRRVTPEPGAAIEVAAGLRHPAEASAPGRRWSTDAATLDVINPETRTLALFRDARSAERARRIHDAVGAWCPKGGPNPWGIAFQRMFDMTLDAERFWTPEALAEAGAVREGWRVRGAAGETWLSLLEGKLLWQHDGAFASFLGVDAEARRRGRAEEQAGRGWPAGRFWVREEEVRARARRYGAEEAPTWLCVRALTNPTNRRTLVAALTPPWGVGNSALIVHTAPTHRARLPLLVANLNALVLDDIARQKMGNTNINMYLLRQLPILPPERYDARPTSGAATFAELITRRALALAVGACEPLDGLAAALDLPPVARLTSEPERARAQAELDALFACMYGLSGEEVDAILEPPSAPHRGFAVLKREEVERYGEFHTASLIRAALQELSRWTRAHP